MDGGDVRRRSTGAGSRRAIPRVREGDGTGRGESQRHASNAAARLCGDARAWSVCVRARDAALVGNPRRAAVGERDGTREDERIPLRGHGQRTGADSRREAAAMKKTLLVLAVLLTAP